MFLPMCVGDEVDVLRLPSNSVVQVHRQRAGLPRPVWLANVDPMPGDMARVPLRVEVKGLSTEQGMRASQPDQQLEEPEQVSIGVEQAPIHPADLIVLAVGIVVPT